ncbi:MAG: agmatine deiminase family protein, partial [Planctomycetes bacterium]|nr:agmatine deiminase family protein [Planctomycetota bacterium]
MSISDQLHRVSDSDYRWPAEWEPHEATWISWPHNRSDWPGKFEAIPWVYGDIVTKLTPGEKVRVLVQSEAHQLLARDVLTRCGADFSRIEFWTIETDRSWIRDYGTFFLVPDPEGRSDQLRVVDFQFSGWAQYPDWQRDNQVTSQIARQLNAPVVRPLHQDRPVVLEGGAGDTNGQGTLIATEACLLN